MRRRPNFGGRIKDFAPPREIFSAANTGPVSGSMPSGNVERPAVMVSIPPPRPYGLLQPRQLMPSSSRLGTSLIERTFAACLFIATTLIAVGRAADKLPLPPAADRAVDFAKDIQPLLAKHCLACHGEIKQQAGLRLDRKSDALAGGDSGKVITLKQSAESELIKLVAGQDPDRIMPPKGDRLTAAEVGLLRAWIDQGAVWPDGLGGSARKVDHWSFKAVQRPALPMVKQAGWVRNPIDAFILARLEAQGVAPAPEADRPTLIRRLSLDLLGLPPTLDEVDAFLADARPDAYEQLVDRLLPSPHFGERWARHWLDMARYADSDGYEKDTARPYAFRYRDWVIDAIARDLPYDQFTTEQIAGDLLPADDEARALSQKIATGFHRNTLTNREGGVDQEEYRVAATVDRVNTTSTIWLGLTVGCSQCHTHKYDPITQREYYQLFAFFNSINEVDLPAPTEAEAQSYAKLKGEFDAAHLPYVAALQAYERDQLPVKQATWEPTLKSSAAKWTLLEPQGLLSAERATLTRQADQSVLVSGTPVPKIDTYTIDATTSLENITALRIEALPDATLGAQGPGRTPHGNFVLSEVKLTATSLSDPTKSVNVALQNGSADFEQLSGGKPTFTAAATLDGKSETGWAVADQYGRRHILVLETKEGVGFAGGTKLTVTLDQQYGTQHTLGRFRLAVTTAARPVRAELVPDEIPAIINLPVPERSEIQKTAPVTYFKTIDPEFLKLHQQLEAHAQLAPKPPGSLAQTVADLAQPRATHIHLRGDFLQQGDPTAPGVLEVLHPATLSQTPTRVDLAKWLVDPANPLTARVTVNHWWQSLWGRALVGTVDDFGLKGEAPTHPELLDWLAAELVTPSVGGNGGVPWSRKRLIKLIVTSAAYRQSSQIRPELLERDPKNLWLARQNRFRLEAEVVRDLNLAVSGLLNPRIGGPSVRPPLPAGVADLGYAGSVRWPESIGADKYRRGMYIFFQRTVPYPMLMAFDSPDSNVACVRRERSNTPLQALTLLNDPVFFEAAQAFGRKLLTDSPGPDGDRLKRAFRRCVAREPSPAELARLHQLEERLRALAQANPEQVAKVAGGDKTNAVEVATAIGLARVLLNLDEFLTRE